MTEYGGKEIGKDLTTGAIFFAGGVVLAIAADASLPFLAAAGAIAALGAGVYQAATLARHRPAGPSLPSHFEGGDIHRSEQKTLVGKY